MRHITTINLRKSKFVDSVSKNRFLIVLAVLYVFGMILGAVLLGKSSSVYSVAQTSFVGFRQIRTDKDFFGIFFSALTSFAPAVIALYLSGTSVVGVALSPLIICYCGFTYGIKAGYIYLKYALQGIAFNSLILIPCTVIAAIGYFICASRAFGFSAGLIRVIMPQKSSAEIFESFKNYCRSFTVVIIIFLISALLDAVTAVAFFKYFSF
ncbi:MAG: hypothetical protein KBS52_03910 [Clostridiales bacterium]|nr:hypothetical protein [Candidatus Equinaster intestinalis]